MRNASIKTKVIILTIAALALGGAGIVSLMEKSHRETVQRINAEALATARSTFGNLLKEEIRTISSAMELIMANPALREPFAKKDREKLLAVTQPVYAGIKARYGITNWNYIDENEMRILVMSDPKNPKFMGTKAVRFNVQEAARTKTWSSGLAQGGNGFAVRVTHPVWDTGTLQGGKLVGYLEMGTEINGFLGSMKAQTGDEYGMVILKKYLKPEDWSMTRQHQGRRNNWEDQADTVLAVNTLEDEEGFDNGGGIAALPEGGRMLGLRIRNGQSFARSVFPVRDAEGAPVGAVFVLSNVTDVLASTQRMRAYSLAGVAALMAVLSGALVLGLRSLVFARLDATRMAILRLVGGDFDSKIVPNTDDEIGQIEHLLEQFRKVFVNTVNELSGSKGAGSRDEPQQ
jgi:Double sensory domain of two-component sensor kinase